MPRQRLDADHAGLSAVASGIINLMAEPTGVGGRELLAAPASALWSHNTPDRSNRFLGSPWIVPGAADVRRSLLHRANQWWKNWRSTRRRPFRLRDTLSLEPIEAMDGMLRRTSHSLSLCEDSRDGAPSFRLHL